MSIRRPMHERVRWVRIGLGGIIHRKKCRRTKQDGRRPRGWSIAESYSFSNSTMATTSTPSSWHLNGDVSMLRTLPSTFHDELCSRLVQLGVHATSGCDMSLEPSRWVADLAVRLDLSRWNPNIGEQPFWFGTAQWCWRCPSALPSKGGGIRRVHLCPPVIHSLDVRKGVLRQAAHPFDCAEPIKVAGIMLLLRSRTAETSGQHSSAPNTRQA